MDIRKGRVEKTYTHTGAEVSYGIRPGGWVDLDEVIHDNVRVRDLFDEEDFEPVDVTTDTEESDGTANRS